MKLLHFFGDKNLSLYNLKHSHEIDIDSFSVKTRSVVLAKQIHSDKIKIITEKLAGSGIIKPSIKGVDGLITNQENLFLCIKTADCVPILLYDLKKKVIAALHSGRIGTEKSIVGKAIKIMKRRFGCKIDSIHAELGPAICSQCYNVGRKIFDDFVRKTGVEQIYPNLDLKKVIISNLLEARISENQIINHEICTKSEANYFSYRENRTTQRQISIIGMK
jgi:purine-nucleoside/S-methyl-5'-thioadenosine phosphorylase / adenosine deaminase